MTALPPENGYAKPQYPVTQYHNTQLRKTTISSYAIPQGPDSPQYCCFA